MAGVDRVLRTGRLVLQPVTAGDHAALLAHWTEPDVCRFLFDGEALCGLLKKLNLGVRIRLVEEVEVDPGFFQAV